MPSTSKIYQNFSNFQENIPNYIYIYTYQLATLGHPCSNNHERCRKPYGAKRARFVKHASVWNEAVSVS